MEEHVMDNLKEINQTLIDAKIREFEKIRDKVKYEMVKYEEKLPENIDRETYEVQLSEELNRQLDLVNKETDLNSEALYYHLKAQASLNKNISKKELTISALEFLEKSTNSKFMKKLMRELIKENK